MPFGLFWVVFCTSHSPEWCSAPPILVYSHYYPPPQPFPPSLPPPFEPILRPLMLCVSLPLSPRPAPCSISFHGWAQRPLPDAERLQHLLLTRSCLTDSPPPDTEPLQHLPAPCAIIWPAPWATTFCWRTQCVLCPTPCIYFFFKRNPG